MGTNREENQVDLGSEQLLKEQPQYGDTKRANERSCENFKVELSHLPEKPKLQFEILRRTLDQKFRVQPQKIRIGRGMAYLAFNSEHERDDAIAKLNLQEWKGNTMTAKVSIAREDLLAKRRKLADQSEGASDYEPERPVTDEDINTTVCPLWSKSYEEQLKFKDDLVRKVLNMKRLIHEMSPSRNLRVDAPKLYEWISANEKICCEFQGVVASPVLESYRNKCEFNISRHGEVGFKIGRYRGGSDRICRPPDNCPLLTPVTFQIIDLFKNYLKTTSNLKGYDMVTHEGHYRQMTVRCNRQDEYLIILDLHPQSSTDDELKQEITKAVESLKSIKQVVSIYSNVSNKSSFSGSQHSLRLVHGADCLYETLYVDPERPLKFRIGPGSFFQVNTKAAEILYRSIVEVAKLGPENMVLDVGCGTGTIGLSLASRVNHVIGIEIVPEAIEDAKANAKENGIENATFFAGKAEDLIRESITILNNKLAAQKIEGGEVVAIVDPPRVGLQNQFIKVLRASTIKRIVYIACDPKANSNLVNLCRPQSKAYQGDPFVPVCAKAFDLFPHTKCCELMIVYERLSLVLAR